LKVRVFNKLKYKFTFSLITMVFSSCMLCLCYNYGWKISAWIWPQP